MLTLQATAKGTARSVTTKFGDRLVLDAIGHDGKEYTVWRPSNDTQLPKIANGERISLGVDSKGKCHLMETLADKAQTQVIHTEPEPTPYNAHNGRSGEIADYIQRLGKLYSFSYKTAQEAMADQQVTGEDTRAIATTLFIQAVKHFSL